MIIDCVSPSIEEPKADTIQSGLQPTAPGLLEGISVSRNRSCHCCEPGSPWANIELTLKRTFSGQPLSRESKLGVVKGPWDSLFPFGRRFAPPKTTLLEDGTDPSKDFRIADEAPKNVGEKAKQLDPGKDFILKLYLRDLALDTSRTVNPHPQEGPVIFDDLARERLVLSQLTRVVHIAFDYQGQGLSIGDLVNEGNIGLMRAAELFDPRREVSFSHYSKTWIHMHMKRALSYQALPVSLPADFNWRRGQVLGAEERLTSALHRSPDDSELSQACGLELPAIRRIRASNQPTFVTFDTPGTGLEPGLTLAETIGDQTVESPVDEAIRHSDHEYLNELLAELTLPQQEVIRLRFGLMDGRSRTLDEVAKMLGYVRQGIHRIETAALGKLRQHIRFTQLRMRPAGSLSDCPYAMGLL